MPSRHAPHLAAALSGAVAVAVLAAPAVAEDQVITASVGTTVTIDSAPADVGLGALPVTGASLGSISVSANGAYTLNVKSDVATMTGWDGSAYNSNTLAASLALTATTSSGTGVGVLVSVGTTDQALATNPLSGLLTETDTYALTATQAATALDPADSYRMVLTYTASAGI